MEKVSQWNRLRAGNCFHHCRVKVWLAWHTGTQGGVRSINNGPYTHNPLAAGLSSHSSHYSTQWGTNNQNISFRPVDRPAGLQQRIFSSRLKNSNVKVTGNDLCHAGGRLGRSAAGWRWRTSCERRWDGASDVLWVGMDEKLRSDPSINCHE